MSKALTYIGSARKAGAIELGETNSGAAVRGGKGRLLVLASDASENARSRAENFVYGRKTLLVSLPFTKAELSDITGVNGCSMAVFTDFGLASMFLSQLAEDDPAYAQAAEEMAARNKKAMMRKKEAVAHERNKKTGKTAVSAKRRKKQ